ncbi:MAG: hypothetical protein ACOC3D_13455, partial [Pseudomonadota bacterium]
MATQRAGFSESVRLESAWPKRGLLAVVVGLSGAAAFGFAAEWPGRSFEPDLARVIAFMALVKVAIAALVLAAIGWRLGQPIGAGALLALLAVSAALVTAPILVWQGVMLGVSSLMFNAALLALGGLAVAEHRAVRRGG